MNKMTNINYQRGYNLEYKTRKILEQNNYMVLRSPASKTPCDLIAFNKKQKLLIQCKKTINNQMYIYGLDNIIQLSKKYNATPILVYGFGRTQAYATEIKKPKLKLNKNQKNKTLEEYLKR